MQTQYLVGIDEAGRGPLAGPVAVGAVKVAMDFDYAKVAGAKDSKQMTERAREAMYEHLCILRNEGIIDFAVAFSDATMIDREGIVPAIQSALNNALGALGSIAPEECEVRLDGGLHAPEHFKNQTTIIRGDQSEIVISLASIAAKVERDRLMQKLAQEYPEYGFEIHKGYGTSHHRAMISTHGMSPIHRATFCENITSQM